MKQPRYWSLFPIGLMLLFSACGAGLGAVHWGWIIAVAVCGLLANVLPLLVAPAGSNARMRFLMHGNSCLRLFLICTLLSIPTHLILAILYLPTNPWLLVISILVCVFVLWLVFWNGIICVYCTSAYLGFKLRLAGIICGNIPIANLIALSQILKAVSSEIQNAENYRKKNWLRREQKICKTKYPIVMVHGFFFRDNNYVNYWGRIPQSLAENGAEIYYGNQPSAASIAENAEILEERFRQICAETGSEKLNIIAHSKGGLDTRYAMAFGNATQYIASVTTVNTPHRGCKFADYLLEKVPGFAQRIIAGSYNITLRRFGEPNSDFMAAARDLTSSHCIDLDASMPLPEGVYCQSVGSKINRAARGKFPLSWSYHLVRLFDGANDGLVGEESFQWGPNYTFLQNDFRDGISHGDVLDMSRRDIPGFDVREFYIQLVSDLRQRGY